MLVQLAALPLLLAAQTSAPQARSSPSKSAPQATRQQGKTMDTTRTQTQAPDINLIEYLGEYADAADGLDPLGLSEQRVDLQPPAKPAAKTDPQR